MKEEKKVMSRNKKVKKRKKERKKERKKDRRMM